MCLRITFISIPTFRYATSNDEVTVGRNKCYKSCRSTAPYRAAVSELKLNCLFFRLRAIAPLWILEVESLSSISKVLSRELNPTWPGGGANIAHPPFLEPYCSKMVHPIVPILPYIWSHQCPLQPSLKKNFKIFTVLELHNLWRNDRKTHGKRSVKIFSSSKIWLNAFKSQKIIFS